MWRLWGGRRTPLRPVTRLTTCSTADFDALYEELQQLGQGGFGSVFAGCRKEDRLPVAIKHIPTAKVTMTQDMILHQVVEGIQGLHSRGVLHRDIKPENLLVETGSGTPRVRVIDLGCGCHHNSGVYSEFSAELLKLILALAITCCLGF
ncbi:unnamed protein product [Arctogadus glacialis]